MFATEHSLGTTASARLEPGNPIAYVARGRPASNHASLQLEQAVCAASFSDQNETADNQSARTMFFFFSNRFGCLGSFLISAVVTLALLFMFGILRF
jgi:hypothetical protein